MRGPASGDAFTFDDAIAVLDYLDDLGVSHLYLSPILTAVEDSTHGYDVTDPVARTGDEPDVVVSYLAARETAERAELGEASRGEVEAALDDLRSVFDTIAAG